MLLLQIVAKVVPDSSMGETIPDTYVWYTNSSIFQTDIDVNVENVGSSLSERLSKLVFYNVYLGV